MRCTNGCEGMPWEALYAGRQHDEAPSYWCNEFMQAAARKQKWSAVPECLIYDYRIGRKESP